MPRPQDYNRQLDELEDQRAHIERRITEIKEMVATRADAFEQARREARVVAREMDQWKSLLNSNPFSDSSLSIFFLGAVSGEWAAQSRYRGDLPGFGGFLICAAGLKIVVDPGRSTLANLHAAGIHPRSLDIIISTHSHWDTTRDLSLLIMGATQKHVATKTTPPQLKLLAAKSVLHGLPMDIDRVIKHPLFPGSADGAGTKKLLGEFATINAPAVGIFDLFMRLRERYELLEIGRSYRLSPDVEVRTRRSYRSDAFGVDAIVGLDVLVQRKDTRPARCVYLSDTEYNRELAQAYAEEDLGPIDVLICNVKTLDIGEKPSGPYQGYTARHLGWQGLLQLTWDFQELGLLTPQSLVVPRAWGIETVTRLDPTDGVMTATPAKLRVYQETYTEKTKQPAVVPGLTWVGVGHGDAEVPRVRHFRRPFPEAGAFRRFGSVSYCSEAIAEVVRRVQPVADNAREILLITGESGTGKDALAQSIHYEAMRGGRLVIINAKDLEAELGHAYLIGYKKGAFTGALEDHDGWLKQADRGTLVIQEASELSIRTQVELMTILEERKYTPLGGKPQELTAQLILTAADDVDALIQEGRLRVAFVNRIHRRVQVPSLRMRLEDIPAIVYAATIEAPGLYPELDDEAIALLQQYAWPGNVRSLRHALMRIGGGRDVSLESVRHEIEEEHTGKELRKPPARADRLDPEDQRVLELVQRLQPIKRRDLEAQLSNGKKKGAVVGSIKRLINMGLVRRLGGGPRASYEAVNQPEAAPGS